jgi:hypothetical protein
VCIAAAASRLLILESWLLALGCCYYYYYYYYYYCPFQTAILALLCAVKQTVAALFSPFTLALPLCSVHGIEKC